MSQISWRGGGHGWVGTGNHVKDGWEGKVFVLQMDEDMNCLKVWDTVKS